MLPAGEVIHEGGEAAGQAGLGSHEIRRQAAAGRLVLPGGQAGGQALHLLSTPRGEARIGPALPNPSEVGSGLAVANDGDLNAQSALR